MKKIIPICAMALVMLSSCGNGTQKEATDNPLLTAYNTPFNVPPFEKIQAEHYLPAYQEALKQHNAEIAAIVDNPEAPTFENTLVALDNSGILLSEVEGVFDNLTSAHTNDQLQAIAKEVAPLLSKHHDNIKMNEKLFNRIKTVYEQKDQLNLTPEQNTLLKKNYKEFVRGGANLDATQKEELKKINSKLSLLNLKFGENVLSETNQYELVLNETDLDGLPQSVRESAASEAKDREHAGQFVFTLHKPSLIPFLQYSERRDLREKLFKAYINRCNHDNEYDNKAIIAQIANLRVDRAHLLGFDSHSEYILDNNMAKKPENVYQLLNQIWDAALPMAKKEAQELQKMVKKSGENFKLEAWDWWFYAEKLKKAKYNIDEEMVRPYLSLDNALAGLFDVVNKLYGIQVVEQFDVPKYHADARVFEIQEANGDHIGIIYMDFHPRASKRSGAWMNSYRKQSRRNGEAIPPVICNVLNFTKPAGDQPALLNFDELTTLFHEFGHGLHGLLSNCTYQKLSGTAVSRDFVELPSQILENWATEPAVLKTFAKHYKTGETIPDELIEKIEKSSHFNQGFVTIEYLSAALLDLDYHSLKTKVENMDVNAFEAASMKKVNMIPEIVVRYRSPYFSHIFAGGYSSGYYSYIWAEVLDADAFEAFKENGIFDPATAKAFRDNVLSRGGTEDPMELYVRFRGAQPKVDAILKRKGLL